MWNCAFCHALSSRTEWTPARLFSSWETKCLPGEGVLLVHKQIRQLVGTVGMSFSTGNGAAGETTFYVQASQKLMHACQCFLCCWCVLSKTTRTAVCWAFRCFPFTFASAWSPGWGEMRLQSSLLRSNRSQINFSSEASCFDSGTRHFMGLWLIFTKAGPCFVCLVSLWDNCVILFFLKIEVKGILCVFNLGVHQWGEKYSIALMSILVGGTTVHFDVMFQPFL